MTLSDDFNNMEKLKMFNKKNVEESVKEFINDYLEWLKTKHRCHCESCSRAWIIENVGDGLIK